MEPARKSITNVGNSFERRISNTLDSVDRISALPDSIIGVVLSLIPTKNAVATSTLSKRWEFMWRTIHNLDFCFEYAGRTVEQDEYERKKFIEFVNHVLLHHDVGVLNKFSLVWTHNCIESHFTSWIKTAITRNVHDLSIIQDYCDDFDMPISVFSCDSLRSLKLCGCICLSAPTVFYFPRLESLDLDRVVFDSDETFEKMIRGCPVLKNLHIDIEEFVDEFRLIISSTSLRRLELILGYHKHLQLEASSLEHLNIYGFNLSLNFGQKELSSLVEANFRIDLDANFSQGGNYNSMVDAVSALDCAKILTLSEYVMEALSCGTTRLSTNFNKLVKLETSIKCCQWSSLQDFIQLSNNLEALKIHKFLMNDPDDEDYHSNWTTPVEVPKCLSNSLKKVILEGYYGDEDECEMISYMLKHGSVLEVMEISCHIHKRRNIELLQDIREFPCESPSCEVKLSGWEMKEQGQGAVTTLP